MEAKVQDRVSLKKEDLGGTITGLLVIGVLGLIGAGVGCYLNPIAFNFSWLFAFMVFYTMAAGSFFWMVVQHATNSGWNILVRRQLENVVGVFWVLALFFIPMLPFWGSRLHSIWPWLNPEVTGHDPLYHAKAGYFTMGFDAPVFFYVRLLIYFGTFWGMGSWFRRRSIQQDSDGHPIHSVKMRKVSYGMIALFAISITFSAIDWMMSMDYHWYSTMWGVYIFAGSAGASLALLVIILHSLKAKGYLQLVNEEHFHIIGKLMLAFTIFWSYVAFSQFMLIWYANIPEETIFYKIRNTPQWFPLSIGMLFGHFIVPFLWFLGQSSKKVPWRILAGAAWMIFVHMCDLYWIILPVIRQSPIPHWKHFLLDVSCVLGIGCIVAAVFLRNLTKANLYPVKDPRLDESIHVKN
ncbi:MAG: hypothetical protein V4507_15860 [Verrucomicrobiota bacterium]